MRPKKIVFDLFRYQILPLDRELQGDLFNNIPSAKELIEQKNEIFIEKLDSIEKLKFKKTATNIKRVMSCGDFRIFRIAANRSINREKPDFTEEQIDTWPSIYVVIWNSPDKQIIAVQ